MVVHSARVSESALANEGTTEVHSSGRAGKGDPLGVVHLSITEVAGKARHSRKHGQNTANTGTNSKAHSGEAALGVEELLLAEQVAVGLADNHISRVVGLVNIGVTSEVPLVNESVATSRHFLA